LVDLFEEIRTFEDKQCVHRSCFVSFCL